MANFSPKFYACTNVMANRGLLKRSKLATKMATDVNTVCLIINGITKYGLQLS